VCPSLAVAANSSARLEKFPPMCARGRTDVVAAARSIDHAELTMLTPAPRVSIRE